VRLISVGYRLVNRTGREATGAVSCPLVLRGGCRCFSVKAVSSLR